MTVNNNNTPVHVAIIMDGNGRWAKKQGLDRIHGHYKGVESVRSVVKAAIETNVSYLTLYAFSKENWGRPDDEVRGLMELFCKTIVMEIPDLNKQGVRIKFIGDRDELNSDILEAINDSEYRTKDNDKLTLVIAMDYSSRFELQTMVRRIANKVKNEGLPIEMIDDSVISENLYTAQIPDPDLMIRTSGECRLSNFLLVQQAYTELYFCDTLWPDFGVDDFKEALSVYTSRRRRYGCI